jgi:hypothetical protein
MAMTIPNCSELEVATRAITYEGSKLKLYTNDVTWAETSTVGSAIECSTGGYTQVSLIASTWSIATGAGGTTETTYASQTITFTSACTAYGYMITNSAGTVLLGAEAFSDGPYTIPSGGGTISVAINIQWA